MPPGNPSTTLFLPELPNDLNETQLERHFRGFVGFSSSRTRHDRNGKLVGFIQFDTIEDATRCRDSMQGNSPFPGLNWHIHFSNNVRGPQGGPPPAAKRGREDEGPPRVTAQRTDSYGAPPPPPAPYDHRAMMAPAAPGHSPHAAATPPGHPGYAQPPPYHAMPQPEAYKQPAAPNFLSMQLPPEASSTLYVEGLPPDATEREVSHIFRRFEGQGYQSIRMVARESSKTPGKNLYLCFIEFDNAHQATVAMHQLQGYRLDKHSSDTGVKIVYAKKRADRGPPTGAPRVATAPAAPRAPERSHEERMDTYESRPTYGDSRPYDNDYERGHRRDGREHSDNYQDDYEDSERGDDDLFQRADEVSMHGLTE